MDLSALQPPIVIPANIVGLTQFPAITNDPRWSKPKMKVCVVANAPTSIKDYSAIVDSMDVVCRINSMENLDKGFSGTKTDMAVVTVGDLYESYGDEYTHLEVLKSLPIKFFSCIRAEEAHNYAEKKGITDYHFTPGDMYIWGKFWTTAGYALQLCLRLWPDCELYFLGTASAAIRAQKGYEHSTSGETEWIEEQIANERITLLETGISGDYMWDTRIQETIRVTWDPF